MTTPPHTNEQMACIAAAHTQNGESYAACRRYVELILDAKDREREDAVKECIAMVKLLVKKGDSLGGIGDVADNECVRAVIRKMESQLTPTHE